MIEGRIVSVSEALAELGADWAQLYEADEYEPTTSAWWTEAAIETHLPLNSAAFTVLLHEEKSIVGIIPFVVAQESILGLSVRVLRPISDLHPTHSDILVASGNGAVFRALLRVLSSIPYQWDIARFKRLDLANPRFMAIHRSLDSSNLRYRLQDQDFSYIEPLPDSYDGYLSERSAKFRNHLRRTNRRISDKARFRVCTNPKDVQTYFEDLLAIESESWKHVAGTAICDVDRQKNFYRLLCQHAAEAGTLHLSLLYLDRKPVVHNLGIVQNRRYSYLKTSCVEATKSLGVATYARGCLVSDMIDRGIKYWDFPAEPYDWEKQWATGKIQHKSLDIFHPSVRSQVIRSSIVFGEKVRSAIRC